MKTLKKIFIILAISLLILIAFQGNLFAYDWMGEVNNQAGATVGAEGQAVVTSVTNVSGAILTVARVICVGVAIIMLVGIGIKYMSSAPGDKATIKKHAVVYVIGAVVMFASSGILGIIQKFSASIKTS